MKERNDQLKGLMYANITIIAEMKRYNVGKDLFGLCAEASSIWKSATGLDSSQERYCSLRNCYSGGLWIMMLRIKTDQGRSIYLNAVNGYFRRTQTRPLSNIILITKGGGDKHDGASSYDCDAVGLNPHLLVDIPILIDNHVEQNNVQPEKQTVQW